MRAPQFARFKPQKRALGAPRGFAGKPAVTCTNERGNHAALEVQAKPVTLKLALWHKSAKEMGYNPEAKKPKVMPIMTLASEAQATMHEPSRVLCAVPERDRYKSRDDRHRNYAQSQQPNAKTFSHDMVTTRFKLS